MRTAQPGLDGGDGARSSEIASDDCAARVADVLNRLGYGFCAFPCGSSAPTRARARLSARAALS